MITPSTRMSVVIEGKADPECSSATDNHECREKMASAILHYITGVRILVKTSSGIRKWNDLRGKTVVTAKDTTSVTELREMNGVRVLNISFPEIKDHAESFAMVETGKANAFIMDSVLFYGSRTSTKTPGDYAVVGNMLTTGPYMVILSRDGTEFKRLVDRVTTNIILDYDIEKLYGKWFQQLILSHSAKFDIPMSFLLRGSFEYLSSKVAD